MGQTWTAPTGTGSATAAQSGTRGFSGTLGEAGGFPAPPGWDAIYEGSILGVLETLLDGFITAAIVGWFYTGNFTRGGGWGEGLMTSIIGLLALWVHKTIDKWFGGGKGSFAGVYNYS